MTTSELVSYLQKRISGFSRPEILFMINEIQNLCYSNVTYQTEYIDPATGMPPYLATTDTIFQYTCPANCRQTVCIFTERPDGYFITSYNKTPTNLGLKEFTFKSKIYWELPLAQSIEANEVTNAIVVFRENPGTTTTAYYHLYTKRPTPLISENIQLIIPPRHHLSIAWGVIALVKDEKFGDNSSIEYWRRNRMPEIVASLNDGAQGGLRNTPSQPEQRW